MVIIELNGKTYEATEIVEDIVDIKQYIKKKQSILENIKLTDINTLEILFEYGVIEEDIIDLAKQSNIIKQQEIDLLQSEIIDLETKLDT